VALVTLSAQQAVALVTLRAQQAMALVTLRAQQAVALVTLRAQQAVTLVMLRAQQSRAASCAEQKEVWLDASDTGPYRGKHYTECARDRRASGTAAGKLVTARGAGAWPWQ